MSFSGAQSNASLLEREITRDLGQDIDIDTGRDEQEETESGARDITPKAGKRTGTMVLELRTRQRPRHLADEI